MNNLTAKIVAFAMATSAVALPTLAHADGGWQNRRQQQGTWRNLGIAGAAVGIYGLAKGDRTLAAAGLLGAGYSAYRYDQDRRGSRYGNYGGGYGRRDYGYGGGHDNRDYDRRGRSDRWDRRGGYSRH